MSSCSSTTGSSEVLGLKDWGIAGFGAESFIAEGNGSKVGGERLVGAGFWWSLGFWKLGLFFFDAAASFANGLNGFCFFLANQLHPFCGAAYCRPLITLTVLSGMYSVPTKPMK